MSLYPDRLLGERDFSYIPAKEQRPRCQLQLAGTVSYPQAWEWQQRLVAERLYNPGCEDVLLLMEHPPVYTLGQGASTEFLKFDPAVAPWPVHRIERGGEVTYHCPGQLVGYPILNLKRHRQDLHWYLRQLEAVIIQALQTYGLNGTRVAGLTGVWVEGYKVAAIGIKVKRWITMHGFALNVCPDLSGFECIVPCGIVDRPVGSLSQFLPGVEVNSMKERIAAAFERVFGVQLYQASRAS